jgi:hypothetical protein
MGARAADDSGPRLYGTVVYKTKEITDQIKFGVVIKIKGELRIQDIRVGLGKSVIPGARFLSTYGGGSPKYLPRTIPNIFSILTILIMKNI